MANIILITHGTGGDIIPFIKLGKILKSNGNDVVILTHCIYEKEAKANNLNFEAIDNYTEYEERNNDLPKLLNPLNEPEEHLEFNKKYCGAERIYGEYKIIEKYCKRKDTVILFKHRFSLSGLLAAEKYGCSAASVFLAPNSIEHLELHEQLIGKQMKDEMNILREKIGLSKINNWTEWMCSPKLKIALWPEWYATEETKSVKDMHAIGFLDSEDNSDGEIPNYVEQFVNNDRKTAVITAGTSNIIDPNFYKIAVKSCIGAEMNTILVTAFDEYVPENLPDSVIRLYKAPLKKLMSYADVVIHHGGMGTITDVIKAGVPQLIMPHRGDGPDNAFRLKEIGIAKVFPELNWNTELITKSLITIVNDKELLLKCRDLSRKMNENNFQGNLLSYIKDMANNNEKYKIQNMFNVNLEENDKSKDGKIQTKNHNMINDISSEKKKALMELLMKKRRPL